jgi:glucose/arabinose dehydrogenase
LKEEAHDLRLRSQERGVHDHSSENEQGLGHGDGRDWLGDNVPPDESTSQSRQELRLAFLLRENVHDEDFDPRDPSLPKSRRQSLSYIDIPAHSAPGSGVLSRQGWPKEFRDDLLVAYHGSWNRSIPTGYKIVRYRLDKGGKYLGVEDFITGWLTKEGTALGRPVDILIRPEGTIFVSDDKAGVIYRIVRKNSL